MVEGNGEYGQRLVGKNILGSEKESRGDLEKGVPGRGNEPGQRPGVRGAWSPAGIAGFGLAGAGGAVLRG